jgi:phytol kinase
MVRTGSSIFLQPIYRGGGSRLSWQEWFGVAAVLAGLLSGLPLIRFFSRRFGASPEVARKMIHVAMGLACSAFPWVFDRALPVWILAGIATLPLGLIRLLPALKSGVGSVLHGIKRPSYGEVLFAPAVAMVFWLAGGNLLLYLIPILILTIADAAGALVGTHWGRRRYGSGEGFKTVEGSLIFWVTAFLCSFVPLLIGGQVDATHALWIGLILAILAMMAEGISDRGFDNIVIPVGCFFILERLMILEMPSLLGRLVVLLILLVLVFTGSRWSTLNGGALFGSVLLGYGCAVIADWRFALPPAAVFVCHVVTTRKHRLTGKFDHRLDAVLSLTIGCMPWVIAAESEAISFPVALAGVSFAMGAQLAMLDIATRACLTGFLNTPIRSALKGWLLASLPGLIWLWKDVAILMIPMFLAMGCMWLAALLFGKIRASYRGHVTGLWIIEGCLALAMSTPAFLIRL